MDAEIRNNLWFSRPSFHWPQHVTRSRCIAMKCDRDSSEPRRSGDRDAGGWGFWGNSKPWLFRTKMFFFLLGTSIFHQFLKLPWYVRWNILKCNWAVTELSGIGCFLFERQATVFWFTRNGWQLKHAWLGDFNDQMNHSGNVELVRFGEKDVQLDHASGGTSFKSKTSFLGTLTWCFPLNNFIATCFLVDYTKTTWC